MSKTGRKRAPGAGRPSKSGHGPVFEIRQGLKNKDGSTWTQQQLADKIKASLRMIQYCEAKGTLPTSLAILSNLHDIAGTTGLKADEEGGVFL